MIIEGGNTVVGEEVDGILSIPREDMQIMNSSVTGTSSIHVVERISVWAAFML